MGLLNPPTIKDLKERLKRSPRDDESKAQDVKLYLALMRVTEPLRTDSDRRDIAELELRFDSWLMDDAPWAVPLVKSLLEAKGV